MSEKNIPDFDTLKSIIIEKFGLKYLISTEDHTLFLEKHSKNENYWIYHIGWERLFIKHFIIKNKQIKSKCPSKCYWSSNSIECNGHKIENFIEGVENHVKKLIDISKNCNGLLPYELVFCVRKIEHVNIYLVQKYKILIHSSNIRPFLNFSSNRSIEFFKILSFNILNIMEFLHSNDLQLGCINDGCYFFNDYKDRVVFREYSIESLLKDVLNNFKRRDDDFTSLGNLIETFWFSNEINLDGETEIEMPDDMKDFVNKCILTNQELLASELLKHPFLQREHRFMINKNKILINNIQSRLNIDFEIVKELGKGAFGRVIKVKHLLDNRLYAVKRVPLKNDEQLYKKTKEIELLSQLTHENVVRYYNSWIEETTPDDFDDSSLSATESDYDIKKSSNSIEFKNEMTENKIQSNNILKSEKFFNKIMCIQMEFCEKSTLRKAIDNNLYNEGKRYYRLLTEICKGLSYVHSKGIIHRDLNPNNIFINSNDKIKIGDFGQATTEFLALQSKFKNTKDTSSYRVGTYLYTAPELMENTSLSIYDKAVDLYSLGIIFFEMCNPPFMTSMERIEKIQALRDEKINLHESEENDIIKGLVQKNINRRFTLRLLKKLDIF